MMPVSRNLCIFLNVGLGEGAKLNAATAALGRTGFIAIPVMIDGIEQSVIIQWGSATAGLGATGNTGNEINFPVSFPNICHQVVVSYDNGGGKVIAGAAGSLTKTNFLMRCDATSGVFVFRWFAIGS
ncbi:gp53-like domain-containing protein [Escherichia coli]|uniref:gp53-like domain-containing protein n=1 Tax=Escherichia coli TaxID=562 RepID=UPI000F4D826B|nr:hypothetical protein [Escherichia coli]